MAKKKNKDDEIIDNTTIGTIKTIVMDTNPTNIQTQDKVINEQIKKGYEFIESYPVSSVEILARFKRIK